MKKTILTGAMIFVYFSAMTACSDGAPVNDTYTDIPNETTLAAETEDMHEYDFTASFKDITTKNVSSGSAVHDPSILKADGKYYIYGSHMSCAACDDLKTWRFVSTGYRDSNTVYGQIYSVYDEAFAYAGSPKSIIPTDDADKGGAEHVWAPDVIYNRAMGKYVMYYCTTSKSL